jgi:hypothetical protein
MEPVDYHAPAMPRTARNLLAEKADAKAEWMRSIFEVADEDGAVA